MGRLTESAEEKMCQGSHKEKGVAYHRFKRSLTFLKTFFSFLSK